MNVSFKNSSTQMFLMFQIEAMVLGSLAWRSDSPLFEAIEHKGSVPSYEEVYTYIK